MAEKMVVHSVGWLGAKQVVEWVVQLAVLRVD